MLAAFRPVLDLGQMERTAAKRERLPPPPAEPPPLPPAGGSLEGAEVARAVVVDISRLSFHEFKASRVLFPAMV